MLAKRIFCFILSMAVLGSVVLTASVIATGWTFDDETGQTIAEQADDWDLDFNDSGDDPIWDTGNSSDWLVPADKTTVEPKADEFPIANISNGMAVHMVQEALMNLGYSISKSEDLSTYFGPTTAMAVKKFQMDYDFTPDGVVTAEMAGELGINPDIIPNAGMHYEQNFYELARETKARLIVNVMTHPGQQNGASVEVYRLKKDKNFGTTYWKRVKRGYCVIGAATDYDNVTPLGVFKPTYWLAKPEVVPGGMLYRWQVGFYLDQLAILAVGQDTSNGAYQTDMLDPENAERRLSGSRMTGGSVRVSPKLAKYIYEKSDDNTIIVIQDR